MIEFDQTTIANMTAALDHACGRLSTGVDTAENRKRIADTLIASARLGRRSFIQLMEDAERELGAINAPTEKSAWRSALFRLMRPFKSR